MSITKPELYELVQQINEAASDYPDAEEFVMGKARGWWRELKGSNFLFINETRGDFVQVLVKIPQAEREKILRLPFVELHKSMGHKGWLDVSVSNQSELNSLLPWIDLSYQLAKPVRLPQDRLEGEPPNFLEYIQTLREAALAFGEVEEFFPHGWRAFRPRKGKIFLYAEEYNDGVNVCVLLPMGEREYALTLPFVEIPPYIGPFGWISANVTNRQELEIVLPWVEQSFAMTQPIRKSKARK